MTKVVVTVVIETAHAVEVLKETIQAVLSKIMFAEILISDEEIVSITVEES